MGNFMTYSCNLRDPSWILQRSTEYLNPFANLIFTASSSCLARAMGTQHEPTESGNTGPSLADNQSRDLNNEL